jgi:hypothetical protein
MPGGSNGYHAALVRRQLTPGLISSLPGTVRLPPFISFSTSYLELDSAARRYQGIAAPLKRLHAACPTLPLPLQRPLRIAKIFLRPD